MAINIRFNAQNLPIEPTLILASRSGKKYGKINARGINLAGYLQQPDEFNFDVYKKLDDGSVDPLWNKIKDFRLIYCKEWNKWFQLTVDISESTETVKTVSVKGLGEAELSQINLYNIQINTEEDIDRDDYVPTVLYNPSDYNGSLLHRMLQKAPNYSINHVDNTIAGLQRTFEFDSTSIHDAFNTVAEEIDCLFIYENDSDENGKPKRMVSVYDLESNCKSCGYRGKFTGKCPECESTNITEGYGKDSGIFVDVKELTKEIQFNTDTDSVKNCFKLEGGDDLMTATIRSCNPNGGDYLWYITDDMKEEMSPELVSKLEEYDALYNKYNKAEGIDFNTKLIQDYNTLVDKYKGGNLKDLDYLNTSINGFEELIDAFFDAMDFKFYLSSTMMPTKELSDTDAKTEGQKLTNSSMSPSAVAKLDSLSKTTADNAVKAKAKSIVDSRYSVEINESNLNVEQREWTGSFVVTNYSDEEDTYTTEEITITINDDLETYLKQQIDNYLAKSSDENLSVTELFKKDLDDLKAELQKYNLDSLNTFKDSADSCLSILIEQGASNPDANFVTDVYTDVYLPYYNKAQAIEAEIAIRDNEIQTIDLVEKNVSNIRQGIQAQLDLEKFLGQELWNELSLYRREDKYSNSNFISDGLSNAQLIAKAQEFIQNARKDIYTSATAQHSITCSLNNLLQLEKFKPILDNFEVGNWIRIKVDDNIYKLRLIKYQINYDNLKTIQVEFSDVTETMDGSVDQASIIQRAINMTTSYTSVKRQSTKGNDSYTLVRNWMSDGIESATTKMVNEADNQEQVWNESGMLFRRYNPDTGTYDDEQSKITAGTWAVTDDNWKTTKTAIGRFYFQDPATGTLVQAYGINAEVLKGSLILGDYLGIYNDAGTLTFDNDGLTVTNGINTIQINPNNTDSLFTIYKEDGTDNPASVMALDSQGNGSFTGKLASDEAHIGDTENYLDFTDGVLTITAKNLTLLDDGNTNIMLNNLSNLSQENISQAAVDFLTSEMVTAGSITTALIQAEQGDFDSLTADNAFIDFLEANLVTASEIKVDDLKAKLAQIDSLEADSAFIQYLESTLVTASEIDVDDLKAKMASIDTLTADSAFVKYLQGLSNTVIEQKADTGYFRDLIAGQISVGDLQAGDIVLTNNMRILSENGSMVMNGDALQIMGTYTDEEGNEQEYVGIQLGYDNSSTPSLILRNENGATILTPEGITANAIADQLIVNDMVRDGTLGKTKLGFEILEPNEQGGIDITKIYDGKEEFGASYTSFKTNTNSALESLDEKIDNLNNFTLYIECPNGTNIHGGPLNLNAKLFNNNIDVTEEYDSSCFTWTRFSQDTYGDIYWNDRHSTGTKIIQVTANDVKVNADFQCKFEYQDITVTSD